MGTAQYNIIQADGQKVLSLSEDIQIKKKSAQHFTSLATLINPRNWTPESPYLYWLEVRILNVDGELIDGYKKRIAIRNLLFWEMLFRIVYTGVMLKNSKMPE